MTNKKLDAILKEYAARVMASQHCKDKGIMTLEMFMRDLEKSLNICKRRLESEVINGK